MLVLHAPTDVHFSLVKRVLMYLRGKTNHGICLQQSSSFEVITYRDVDWTGCIDDRRSNGGWCVYLGHSFVS